MTAAVAFGAVAALASPTLSGGGGIASAELVSQDAPAAHLSHQGAPEDLAGAQVFTPVFTPPPAPTAGLVNAPERASRSSDRRSLTATEAPASKPSGATRSRAAAGSAPAGSPKQIAQTELAARGWSGQFGCLNSLWNKESGWKVSASNPSGAYGIPQALPGSKMASAGSDWKSNPATQIAWGLDYIAGTYGTPCAAWSHSQSNNWY